MAAPRPADPAPTALEAAALIDELYRRRVAADDEDLHLWSDRLPDVVDYALRRRGIPHALLVEDARAALRLIRVQRAHLEALELTALETCRERPQTSVSWSRLARDLGVATPQAAHQRRDRLRAAHAARQQAGAQTGTKERERAWTMTHADRIRTTVAALVRAAPDVTATGNTEAIEWLEDMEIALDGYRASHTQHAALLTYCSLIVRALGADGEAIPAVRTAAALAAEYAAACDGA